MTRQKRQMDGESRRERSRTRSQALSEFLARAWLVVVWLFTFTAFAFWDSGPVQGAYWTLLTGFVVGLIPVWTVNRLMTPRQVNPPNVEAGVRLRTDWGRYGILALVILGLILADKFAHPGTLVDSQVPIPSSTVTLANGPGSLARLDGSKTLYNFSRYKNLGLEAGGTLRTYLRSGDILYKAPGGDEMTLDREGQTSEWQMTDAGF